MDISNLSAQQLLDLVNSTLAQGKAALIFMKDGSPHFEEADSPA